MLKEFKDLEIFNGKYSHNNIDEDIDLDKTKLLDLGINEKDIDNLYDFVKLSIRNTVTATKDIIEKIKLTGYYEGDKLNQFTMKYEIA